MLLLEPHVDTQTVPTLTPGCPPNSQFSLIRFSVNQGGGFTAAQLSAIN